MRICVMFRADFVDGEPVPAYPWSYVDAFSKLGHEVFACGEGHPVTSPDGFPEPDLLLEIENGRNEAGELRFQHAESRYAHSYQTAVLLYDTHGYPDLHQAISRKYGHLFFGSWCKRDLFAEHKSAHWCPSATDLRWFGASRFTHIEPKYDVGFFGSKKGLARAHDLIEICKANGWTYDVRQVANNRNPHRWPATAEAMAACRVLFNRGQKHDGPNLRVMESMAMGRPLLSDWDQRSGMGRLFGGGQHYLHYTDRENLEASVRVAMSETAHMQTIADAGRREVEAKHLVIHRAAQILEVVCRS